MESNKKSGIIPKGKKGKDITVESERIEKDLATTRNRYQLAKNRLLDINHWGKLTGKLFANFQLVDSKGKELKGTVKKGDYVKINIFGPGTQSGEGDDWVYVEDVAEYADQEVESVGIKVKPASNPTRPHDDTVSHFYSKDSSSSFTVTRRSEKIVVGIYDRNIEINTDTDNGFDKARNAIYGAVAKTFFSKIQWKLLAEGILEN